MALYLHNPANQAHIEDLKDRLSVQLASTRPAFADDSLLIARLVDVVRAMDNGAITTRVALDEFARHHIPGFSFDKWLVDMLDEGIYLDMRFEKAA